MSLTRVARQHHRQKVVEQFLSVVGFFAPLRFPPNPTNARDPGASELLPFRLTPFPRTLANSSIHP